jgi:hypothetical protein
MMLPCRWTWQDHLPLDCILLANREKFGCRVKPGLRVPVQYEQSTLILYIHFALHFFPCLMCSRANPGRYHGVQSNTHTEKTVSAMNETSYGSSR